MADGIKRVFNDEKGRVGQVKAARKAKATANSNHNLPVAPNRLAQGFEAAALDQKWVSNIIFIWTDEGWLLVSYGYIWPSPWNCIHTRPSGLDPMAGRMAASLFCDAFYGIVAMKASERRRCPFGSGRPILFGGLSGSVQITPAGL